MSPTPDEPTGFWARAPWLRLFSCAMRDRQDVLQWRGQRFSVVPTDGAEAATGPDGRWPSLFRPLVEAPPGERPWVWCKAATSLDGRIATRTGDAQWITDERARRRGRRLRTRVDAIMVGIGTVLADDPLLTSRSPGREPLRVVMDSRGRTPPDSRLLNSAGGSVLLLVGPELDPVRRAALTQRGAELVELPRGPDGRVELEGALRVLRGRGCRRLLVEGGATLHGAFFDQCLVDYVHWFISPRVLGGQAAPGAVAGQGRATLAEAPRLRELRIEALGTELFVSGRVSA